MIGVVAMANMKFVVLAFLLPIAIAWKCERTHREDVISLECEYGIECRDENGRPFCECPNEAGQQPRCPIVGSDCLPLDPEISCESKQWLKTCILELDDSGCIKSYACGIGMHNQFYL